MVVGEVGSKPWGIQRSTRPRSRRSRAGRRQCGRREWRVRRRDLVVGGRRGRSSSWSGLLMWGSVEVVGRMVVLVVLVVGSWGEGGKVER